MGDEIFLQEKFQRIGDRLAKTENPDFRERNAGAIRSNAILNPCANFALGIDRVGNQTQNQAKQAERFRQRGPHQEWLRLHEKIQNLHI